MTKSNCDLIAARYCKILQEVPSVCQVSCMAADIEDGALKSCQSKERRCTRNVKFDEIMIYHDSTSRFNIGARKQTKHGSNTFQS